jgi:hypothetical protein
MILNEGVRSTCQIIRVRVGSERRFAEVIGSGGGLRTLAEEIEKYLTGIEVDQKSIS